MRRIACAAAMVLVAGCCWGQMREAAPAHVVKGPYVQNVSHDGVTIMWEGDGDAGAEGEVAFTEAAGGKTIKAKANATPLKISGQKGHVLYRARAEGLEAGKEYGYEADFAGGAKATGKFTTTAQAGTPIRFAVYGDSRSNPEVCGEISRLILKAKPVFAVHTGDLVYGGNSYPVWEKDFFGPSRELIRNVPVFPVMGNHEESGRYLLDLFDYPTKERYCWSVECGDAYVAGLDYMRLSARGAELKWLREDLAKTKAKWKFVALHTPLYSRSKHGSNIEARNLLEPILRDFKVDVVFAGHNHLYERTTPIVVGNRGTKTPWAVTHIVAGTAGANIYDIDPAKWDAAWKTDFHFCTLDVTPTRVTITATDRAGKEFDKVTLEKEDGKQTAEYLKKAAYSEEIKD